MFVPCHPSSSVRVATLALLVACSTTAAADDLHPAALMPETTIGYFEVTRPVELLAQVLDHPIATHIQTLDVFKTATQSEQYRSFLTGRKFFEIQIGAEWRAAIEALSANGIAVGVDAATEGGVLLVRGKDEATMENFRAKILEMTRLSGGKAANPDTYRDVTVYRIDKGGAAVVRDWLVATNKPELGKAVLDRLLDASDTTDIAGTLAGNAQFKQALTARSADVHGWGFANVQAIRESGSAKKVFDDPAENPLAELLAGGIQTTLRHTPYVTLELAAAPTGLDLSLHSPWQADWVPEERAYYFGLDDSGAAPALPDVPDTIMTVSAWRDVSQMWLRAGDLFNEQMNDQLAAADSTLTTIFAGHDFGEEILGSLAPEIGLIVTRQDFTDIKPVPALKLPAFALVTKLRDPETMRPELRRTFQSAIGFFNIVGAQEGRPQLEMDMQKDGDVDLITSRYVPEKKDRESTTADVIYNFSPSAAFAGDRFILSSTATLAQQLATADAARPASSETNTAMTLHADAITKALDDNREQLISQNMLEEGHSRDEAEAAVALLFEGLRWIKGAGLDLQRTETRLTLNLSIDVNESPRD